MPHSREVQSTSHDRHDPMLVAALAAGDLAGTDRDQAITLTRTCSDCAALHDDLVALARATAAAPPPFATPARDFRLTPVDAARLRPGGWRRLVAAFSRTPAAVSRSMGVGLATLGLVGLLVGNVQLGGPSSAAAPLTTGAGAAASLPGALPQSADMVQGPSAASGGGQFEGAAPAASAGPATTAGPGYGDNSARSLAPGGTDVPRAAPVAAPDGKSASGVPAGSVADGSRDAAVTEPGRPLNLLFGGAVILGLAILVASRLRSRRTA